MDIFLIINNLIKRLRLRSAGVEYYLRLCLTDVNQVLQMNQVVNNSGSGGNKKEKKDGTFYNRRK